MSAPAVLPQNPALRHAERVQEIHQPMSRRIGIPVRVELHPDGQPAAFTWRACPPR
jgi:hypothetical protein